MSGGAELVAALRRVGYPRAGALSGADLDWLLEGAEEAPFVRWFCGAAGPRLALGEAELRAFEALRERGRPVLGGAALREALGARPRPARADDRRDDGDALEALEREVRALRAERALKLGRRDALRLLTAGAGRRARRLRDEEDRAARALRHSQGVASAAQTTVRLELDALARVVADVTALLGSSEAPTPLWLSRCPVDTYLGREERSTAALAAFAKAHLAPGAREEIERASGQFQRLDLQSPLHCNSPDDPEDEDERLEMSRLQLAHVAAQHQLLSWQTSHRGLRARITWLADNLHGLTDKAVGKDHLDAKISSLNSEVLKLEEEITHIKDKRLPPLIRENVQFLNIPIVKGDFDLQIAKQDHYTTRQNLVLNQLIKQKASFELLQLSYELELRKHQDIYHQLEILVQEFTKSNVMLHQRLEMLTDPSVSQQMSPRNTIDTKDYSTHRLYQLLEGETKKKELFITYGNLEKAAEKFKTDVSLIQNQFAVSAQEHSLFLSKVNNDVDMLCDALYHGGNQLLLSDQELLEQFHQVESQSNKSNRLFTDILADIKTKRKILASNKLHQMERNLYVYFLKDEDYLKDIVEKLENQSKIKAVGLET